jgi:hypothetical protein
MSLCARFNPPGFVGKGCPRSQFPRCICYWLCLGLHKELATCSRYVFHPALHFHHWRHYEQIRVQVHTVSLDPLTLMFLS